MIKYKPDTVAVVFSEIPVNNILVAVAPGVDGSEIVFLEEFIDFLIN